MGCSFKTEKGMRVRISPVAAPVQAVAVGSLSISNILSLLKLPSVAGSARFTAEELQNAVVRVWREPEKGYFTEARIRPGAAPIVRPISQAEAIRWQMQAPAPAEIAHAFTPLEVPSY